MDNIWNQSRFGEQNSESIKRRNNISDNGWFQFFYNNSKYFKFLVIFNEFSYLVDRLWKSVQKLVDKIKREIKFVDEFNQIRENINNINSEFVANLLRWS